ncbi:hypothetical protein BXZ70DRAFT_921031 [Cristinia sonorae]|uniref:ASX DEUBAD domain-containing protein n=1 Tax=Cristinia sonorae TaxID=1940300 RepID=A0A8K0UWZ7_9AGAR|nr:hypothetical protein BXZ70DRAFT_921031 [Cristinia sonorae]
MSGAASSRPRRTTSATTEASSSSSAGSKRKARDNDGASSTKLDYLLTNSKSKLTTMDITDVLNYENFVNLSEESQVALCRLMPPTAFSTFSRSLPPLHPGYARGTSPMDVDTSNANSPATLNPNFFSSPAFLAAANTFQDHLYSSWMTTTAIAQVNKFKQGIQDGSLHAQWKDEAWNDEAQPSKQAGFSASNDIANLAKRSLIKEGDILVYKRTLQPFGVEIEKDLLVRSIDSKTNSLDLLLRPGTTKSLPSDQLVIGAPDPTPPTLTMEGILSSTELEEAVLEVDGRVTLADFYRTTANTKDADRRGIQSLRAAKAITVWRWQEEMMNDFEMQMALERGGRELLTTVYFLRNA